MTAGARIGRRIKELREKSGCTQEEVANELFISQSYLRKIEHGEANPSVNMVAKISTFLLNKLHKSGHKQEEVIRLEARPHRKRLWNYRTFREHLYDENLGWYYTYGITVTENQKEIWTQVMEISDVSLDHHFVENIVNVFTRHQLSPIHLREVLDNLLP